MAARTQLESGLLNQRQAAERLGVSRRTLGRLVESGTVRPIRIAGLGRPRFRRDEIERLIAGEG